MADADDAARGRRSGTPRDAGTRVDPPRVRPRPADESVMSLVDHLGELRTRLFRSILAVAVGSVVGFCCRRRRPSAILRGAAPGRRSRSRFTGLGDAFVIQVKIAIVIGIDPGDAGPALPALGVRLARA